MRVMKARSAIVVVVMRRLMRALWMSWPTLARARLTGSGKGGVDRIGIIHLMAIFIAKMPFNVNENSHYMSRKLNFQENLHGCPPALTGGIAPASDRQPTLHGVVFDIFLVRHRHPWTKRAVGHLSGIYAAWSGRPVPRSKP
ncbi:MAG: hypothetical protein ABSG20_20980 [Bradyrhizobium sp.]